MRNCPHNFIDAQKLWADNKNQNNGACTKFIVGDEFFIGMFNPEIKSHVYTF